MIAMNELTVKRSKPVNAVTFYCPHCEAYVNTMPSRFIGTTRVCLQCYLSFQDRAQRGRYHDSTERVEFFEKLNEIKSRKDTYRRPPL